MPPEELTSEDHAVTTALEAWVMPGLKRRNNWATGQRVSLAEFKKAVRNFLNGGTAGESPLEVEPVKLEPVKPAKLETGGK